LLTAALLAAATLLGACALFFAVFFLVAITLLAALLSRRHGFDRFVRIVLFFHNTFLSFADWSFALREKTFPLSLQSCLDRLLDWKFAGENARAVEAL